MNELVRQLERLLYIGREDVEREEKTQCLTKSEEHMMVVHRDEWVAYPVQMESTIRLPSTKCAEVRHRQEHR